jgi:hypothetical protein
MNGDEPITSRGLEFLAVLCSANVSRAKALCWGRGSEIAH